MRYLILWEQRREDGKRDNTYLAYGGGAERSTARAALDSALTTNQPPGVCPFTPKAGDWAIVLPLAASTEGPVWFEFTAPQPVPEAQPESEFLSSYATEVAETAKAP